MLEIEYIKSVAPRKQEDPSLHDDWVSSVDGSNRFILTGCYDGLGRIWEAAGVCTHVLEGHNDAVTSVRVVKEIEDDNDTNPVVATGSKDKTVKLWKFDAEPEADNLKIRAYRTLRGHTASVQSLAAPPSGDMAKVRAGIIGYPNVGKSSLINRLLKRRMCPAAPRPGVTRVLKWVRFGSDLELLDSPGIIPMRMSDQSAAIKLAICDDIGERSYNFTDVAGILVQMLSRLPGANNNVLWERYKIDTDGRCGNTFVHKLAVQLFNGDEHQAAFRILSDFRKGRLGTIALERPPVQPRVT